ncbi:MAG: glyoxylase-like metal-dependent hydrolase (beta-lactamase superfamily II) [Kiritimatiellia bacterium]|jgi:glyoxylase-like metal-dependent hydrolase (beta-lactamase superfamily II)
MRVHPLIASQFASDGGAMFGLVPKPIWSKLIEPDEHNRIPQNANALLVELDDGRRALIDSGCGPAERYSEKERQIHGLGPGWPLMEALTQRGLTPADIDVLILSHLHWDHAGGAATAEGHPAFPNAQLIVHEQEWSDAIGGDPLLYKAYPKETIAPLQGYSNRLLVSGDEVCIAPGITSIRTGGHTQGHCAFLLESDQLSIMHPEAEGLGGRVLFAADVCPTTSHLRLVFQAAYDTYPLDTRRWKQQWLPRCAAEHIPIFFCHDPRFAGATIFADERKEFKLGRTLDAR